MTKGHLCFTWSPHRSSWAPWAHKNNTNSLPPLIPWISGNWTTKVCQGRKLISAKIQIHELFTSTSMYQWVSSHSCRCLMPLVVPALCLVLLRRLRLFRRWRPLQWPFPQRVGSWGSAHAYWNHVSVSRVPRDGPPGGGGGHQHSVTFSSSPCMCVRLSPALLLILSFHSFCHHHRFAHQTCKRWLVPTGPGFPPPAVLCLASRPPEMHGKKVNFSTVQICKGNGAKVKSIKSTPPPHNMSDWSTQPTSTSTLCQRRGRAVTCFIKWSCSSFCRQCIVGGVGQKQWRGPAGMFGGPWGSSTTTTRTHTKKTVSRGAGRRQLWPHEFVFIQFLAKNAESEGILAHELKTEWCQGLISDFSWSGAPLDQCPGSAPVWPDKQHKFQYQCKSLTIFIPLYLVQICFNCSLKNGSET